MLLKQMVLFTYVDAKKIEVKTKNGEDTYYLANFELANSGTCNHQRPIVQVGEEVEAGKTIIADGTSYWIWVNLALRYRMLQ